jgi:homoserine dehydrogenase
MTSKKLNIGMFGYGVVGTGLYEVIHQTKNLDAAISKIVVKNKDKERNISLDHFSYDKNDILNDPNINVVVELIDNADEAYEIVTTAMKNGKAVVSANKKLIADHFEELYKLQEECNVPFLYEASVCGSIPIIRNLEEYYNNDFLNSIEGIVNGSTNYILTKTFQENMPYEEALKEAQDKGYAETNPILDTGGFDAKSKLQILLAHSFGIISKPEEVFNMGIQNLGELEVKYAQANGLQIKLLAQAVKKNDDEIMAFVLPKFIKPENPFSNVNDVFNGVKVETAFASTQMFTGRGAGSLPTASAVLSDISALSFDYRYECKKIKTNKTLKLTNDFSLKVMLRHESAKSDQYRPYFTEVDEYYANHQSAYLVGNISFENIKEVTEKHPDVSFVMIQLLG